MVINTKIPLYLSMVISSQVMKSLLFLLLLLLLFFFFVFHATSKNIKIFCLYSHGQLTFMKSLIILIAAKFQYVIPSLRTLAVTYTHGLEVVRIETVYSPTKILKPERCSWREHFPPPLLEKLVLKTVQWNVIIIIIIIIIIIVVVVVVDDYTYCWVYLSSDHPFQVYYKMRQVLLQSTTAYFIAKCDCLSLQSARAFLLKIAKKHHPPPPLGQATLRPLLGKQNIQTKGVY